MHAITERPLALPEEARRKAAPTTVATSGDADELLALRMGDDLVLINATEARVLEHVIRQWLWGAKPR